MTHAPSGDAAMAAEAFAIADSTMTDQLMCHCLLTTHPDKLFLCGEDGTQVGTLAEAGGAVREAFSWLDRRGLARVERSGGQEVIVLGENGSHAG